MSRQLKLYSKDEIVKIMRRDKEDYYKKKKDVLQSKKFKEKSHFKKK